MKTPILYMSVLLLTGCGPFIKDIHNLQSSQEEQNLQIAASQTTLRQLAADVEKAQSQLQQALTQLAQLQLNVQVTAIVDPCGDGPGFDEVLLKTSAGLIAYFETGGNRHLSILGNGTYQTTDAQSCIFTVSNGEIQ